MFFCIFSINLAASAAKYCEKESVNQSAASAASPDYVKFQAVIKSAASAADLMEMCIFGAFSRQKCAFPKNESLKMCLPITPRGCGSGPHPFSQRPQPFPQYLAPLGAKYIEKS